MSFVCAARFRMQIQGGIACLVAAALLVAGGASCHKLQYLKQLHHPAVHAVPTLVHTTIAHKPLVLPAPLVAPRPLVQPLLLQPRPPVHSALFIHAVPRHQLLVQPVFQLQPRLVAPPQVLVQHTRVAPPLVTQHQSLVVSGLVAGAPPAPRPFFVPAAPPPAPALPPPALPAFPAAPPAVQPLLVLPEPRPAVAAVPLQQPRLVHPLPTRLDEGPPKVSYVVHQHTKLVQVAPPPVPAPAVLPPPIPTAVVQPLATVTPLQEQRQVQVIREVIRPTYVIERLSKKQRKFRKIKMLKNCSLLKKLKNQLAASAENYQTYDSPAPFSDDAHVDSYSHFHLPFSGGSAGVQVYRSFHGPEFAKRNGR